MLKWLQKGSDAKNPAFEVVFFLLEDSNVHDVARNGELYENDGAAAFVALVQFNVREGFPFRRHRLDRYII